MLLDDAKKHIGKILEKFSKEYAGGHQIFQIWMNFEMKQVSSENIFSFV